MRGFLEQAALVAFVFAVGCGGEKPVPTAPAPADHPSLGLAEPSGSLAWRGLDALDSARITLPAPAAEATPHTGAFPLAGEWATESRTFGRLRVFSHPLPFLTDMVRPNYAPMGAKIWRGDVEIPFVNDPEDLRGGGWFVDRGAIQLLALESPEKWREAPRLEVPELAAGMAARTWSGAGSPAAFVRTEVTVAGITRPGIQLPPGAEITFPVDVPAGATLDFGVTALPPLLPEEGPGGGTVAWLVDGKAIGERVVLPDADPADERVSLSAWAGERVELTFRAPSGSGGNVVVTAPTIASAPAREPRHVVMVGIDTLRPDALGVYGYAEKTGRATSPELDAWANQSVLFENAWAPAPRTRPSFRTALTGRWPIAAAAAPTVAEAFAREGFRTAGVVANVHLVPRFGFNDGFEHWHYENGARADVQIARALAWQEAHAQEDTFLFLHIMDPHTFYNAPEPYGSRFQEGQRPKDVPEVFDRWQVYNLLARPSFGDAEKRWIRAAYDGEVAYTSAMLGGFFAALEEVPGRTVTLLHTDHGEEFFEHGAYEHNHSLYDELVRAALWIRAPGGQSGTPRVKEPVGLVDIAPTLLELVGASPVATDGRSLAAYVDPARAAERAALGEALRARPLPLGHLMFGKERWAVVKDGAKYILHTASGAEELYDLAADPGEQTDLSATAPPERLDAMRAALAEATGWPVRPGWRLRFEGPRRPVELRFADPVAAAGIIDPEAERTTRSNLEWGEKPLVQVSEVGSVVLSADRTVVRFTPGPRATGHRLWVACEGACPEGTARVAETEAPLVEGLVAAGEVTLESALGTLIQVPTTEEKLAAPASAQMQALEALGYIAPD